MLFDRLSSVWGMIVKKLSQASFRLVHSGVSKLIPASDSLQNAIQLIKANLYGLAAGLHSFYLSKPVLIGMAAGLITSVISAIFMPPIAPLMLYLAFAKTAVVSGTLFGVGSTLIQGISNFVARYALKKNHRQDVMPSIEFNGHGLPVYERAPIPTAIRAGWDAASRVKPGYHTVWIRGDGLNSHNAASFAEQLVDGEPDAVQKVVGSVMRP